MVVLLAIYPYAERNIACVVYKVRALENLMYSRSPGSFCIVNLVNDKMCLLGPVGPVGPVGSVGSVGSGCVEFIFVPQVAHA